MTCRLLLSLLLSVGLSACGSDSGQSSSEEVAENCAGSEFARSMLASINNYRAEARHCGDQAMPAVAPLSWNCTLAESSRLHSLDMATNNFFDHTGSDGLSVGNRVTNAGYRWRTVGENIAAGQTSIEQVMQGWINSPGHCVNIMRSSYTEVGAALVTDDTSDYRRYWTQNFAAPFPTE